VPPLVVPALRTQGARVGESGERGDQGARGDVFPGPGSTRATTPRAGVLSREQASIPPQDGVHRHDSGHLVEARTAQGLSLHGQPPALVVGQPHATRPEMFAEEALLLAEVVDDLELAPVRPAGEKEFTPGTPCSAPRARNLRLHGVMAYDKGSIGG